MASEKTRKGGSRPSSSTFTITHNDVTETYSEDERNRMTRVYRIATQCLNGSERDRCKNVYFDLLNGKKDCRDDYFGK